VCVNSVDCTRSALGETRRSFSHHFRAPCRSPGWTRPGRRMFSLRHEFGNDWSRSLAPAPEAGRHAIELLLTPKRFPPQLRGRKITIKKLELFLKFKDETVEVNNQRKTFLQLLAGSGDIAFAVTPPGAAAATSSATQPHRASGAAPNSCTACRTIAMSCTMLKLSLSMPASQPPLSPRRSWSLRPCILGGRIRTCASRHKLCL
jgi:hypothetical protein